MEHLDLPDGRTLEYLVEGPPDAIPLVLHHGTPGSAVRYAPVFEATIGEGFRIVHHSRPGYGSSTPHPGRKVADVAADVAALLDALGATTFVTVGKSGGGPHALACAALLPDRCLAAASIAGVAPWPAEGLDWLDGMGAENLEEFGAARAGVPALEAFLTNAAAGLADVQPTQVIEAFGDLLSAPDRKTLVGSYAEYQAASLRQAVSAGIQGWRDDDLAFFSDWGFDLSAITRPVSVWQGDQDRMVPYAHGPWLAAHVPGAALNIVENEGHLSLIENFATVASELRKFTE